MGKAALLAVTGLIVVGSIYSFSINRSTLETDERVADFQYETLAKNAAQIGHNRAEKKLAEQVMADSYGAVDIDGEHSGIPYEVKGTWNSTDDEVTVVSEATARKDESNEIVYWMRSRYKKENVATDEIAEQAPKFMQYAILAENKIDLKGNLDVEFTAEGDEANKLNADIHSNTSLVVSGNAASVRGYGTSAGSVDAKEGIFDPYNSDGSETEGNIDPVDIPDFDASEYVSKLGGVDKTSNGDVEISGSGDLPALNGTREDPFVWHVKGRLDITGDIEAPGYVLFVVRDGFRIAGNVTIGQVDYDSSVESNFGIYTEGDGEIDQTGNSTFYGQIFADGDMDIDVGGNADLYGSITTHGTVTLHGTPFLHYRPASPALTQAWQELETQVRLTAHYEGKK